MPTLYELSVEEVALAMSVVGNPGSANALLEATFGRLGEEERRGRLMAAGASLAARSLLVLEGEKDPILDQELSRVVAILNAPAFTLKYDKGSPEALQSVAYHFARGNGTVVEQTVRQGVVHRLAEVARPEVVKRGARLFAIPDQIASDVHAVRIPRSVFDDARSRAPLQPTTAQALLERAGLPPEQAQMLVDDLRDNRYQGSVMRVDYDEDGHPSSDHGFLVLQSDQRTWVLSIVLEQGDIFVLPQLASVATFQQKVEELIG